MKRELSTTIVKAEANFRWNRLNGQSSNALPGLGVRKRRTRQKRELLDVPFSSKEDMEKIISNVAHRTGWAKVGPGSIKVVKRVQP